MDNQKPTLEERLSVLREAYRQQVPAKLNEISALWSSLNTGDWDWDIAHKIHLRTHTLAGSAPTFGFVKLGQNARRIEHLCKQWIDNNKAPSEDERNKTSAILTVLVSNEEDAIN